MGIGVEQAEERRIGEPERALRYFAAVERVFRDTARKVPVRDYYYSVGPYTLRLRIAGGALDPRIIPALEHLATGPVSQPSLTVCLWDSDSTGGQPPPPPPWSPEDLQAHGEVRTFNTSRIHTLFDGGTNTLNMLDLDANLGLYWIRDARDVPYYETGAPLRAILHWWTAAQGCQFVHGAAVGTDDAGVLLAAKGGSGKSTTALACLEAGLRYAGDDYCLLSEQDGPCVYSLYSTAKLNFDNLHTFPGLRAERNQQSRHEPEKALYFVHQHAPKQIIRRLPIRALLVPRITGRPETRLVPASAAAGLLALAPSSIFQLPGRRAAAFDFIVRFTRRVPCYTLELGTRIPDIPGVIRGCLEMR